MIVIVQNPVSGWWAYEISKLILYANSIVPTDWLILSYFNDLKINPDSIWIGLCNGDLDASSKCELFSTKYVEKYSARIVLTTGPEEYQEKRGVNDAATVLNMWRGLIMHADQRVLNEKRHEDPANREYWSLTISKPPGTHIIRTAKYVTWEISNISE